MYDFNNMNNLLTRLMRTTKITVTIRKLFNRKSAHIGVAAFKSFTELGREDREFGEFLHWFIAEGKHKKINGKSWSDLDVDRSTTDSSLVYTKLDYFVGFINKYITENKKVA